MDDEPLRAAAEVARRCLCFELLLQRLGLETDDDALDEREAVRRMWTDGVGRLGLDETILPDERALLERPVGGLSEEDLDDLHGRASGALVLLWALGRVEARPNLDAVEAIADALAEHGFLGDGSISRAREAVAAAALRPRSELEAGHAAYAARRGRSRELDDPEKIVAAVALHHLEWVMDPEMSFTVDDADD